MNQMPAASELVKALSRAIESLEAEQDEHRGVNYPTKLDLEIGSAISVLEDAIKALDAEEKAGRNE